MGKKVSLAVSGGIDSAVAARHLMDKGYEIHGLTMVNHDGPNEVEAARAVCDSLGITHEVLDLREAFHREVITSFARDYFSGITPNPCIICNKKIKFGKLMDHALAHGSDYFATGHYVRIHYEDGLYRLKRGLDSRKDQSYLFHFMGQEKLSRLMTPLGEYPSKNEVREIATRLNLPVSGKKDSDGICFTSDQGYSEYLIQHFPDQLVKGHYHDRSGKVIGSFPSIIHHTIGQKRNLFIEGKHNYRVVEIKAQKNIIVLGGEEDLLHQDMQLTDVSFTGDVPPELPQAMAVQIFQWGNLLPAVLWISDGRYVIRFNEKVRAIAKGQYAVFYRNDEVLGGGRIQDIIL